MKKLLYLITSFFLFLPSLKAQTIADLVASNPNFSTLNAALQASGLDEVLDGEGPFTVFAPTNAAFEQLQPNLVNAFLTDPDGVLSDILLYHVATGEVFSIDLSDDQVITTALGQNVTIGITGGNTFVNQAMIMTPDIEASNGVVHVINGVLSPQTTDVFDIVANSEVHNTLEAALIAAGLDTPGLFVAPPSFPFFANNYTLFAPTDAAFEALPDGVLDALLGDPEGELSTILQSHAVAGNVLSTDLFDGQIVETLSGASWEVSISSEGVFINGAQVTVTDLVGINGIVHVIDAVLAEDPTIFEIVANSEVHNTLEDALIAAELDGTLSGEGAFTLFAPTDEAFAALPENFVNALLTDPSGVLTDILLYHVVGSVAFSTDLSNGQNIGTLFGQDVTVSITGEGVFINGAQVIIADLEASNGVVHVIDAVLVPETTTITDVVVNSEVHTTLETALIEAGLDGVLAGPGAFTVFAPTDDAFASLPDGVLDALLADPEDELTDILLYHVVDGIALSTDLSDGQEITTLFGQDVTVTINMDGVFINDAQVTVADIVTVNGVVHVIDAVLLPAALPSIFDIVATSEVHNTLEAALIAAGLDGTLAGEGAFTLFAPTDEAFEALPANFVNALLTDPSGVLSDILLYHVVGSVAFSTDLSDNQNLETLFGQDVNVSINSEGVFINGAQVIIADLEASNGVVHVIDAVLVPQTTTIADVVAASDVHTTLLAALQAAELVEVLDGPGAYTVFAPTNEAFDALPDGLLEELLADPTGDLSSILLYHVVNGIALSSDLSNGQSIATLFGENVNVAINSEGIFINDAQVTIADIVTVNGVVHVIDAVLIPSTISSTDNAGIAITGIYPNPAGDLVNVAFDALSPGRTVVNILSLSGQVIKSYDLGSVNTGASVNTIGVGNMASGFYLLSIELDGARSVQKLQIIR